MKKETIWSAQDVIDMCKGYMNENHVNQLQEAYALRIENSQLREEIASLTEENIRLKELLQLQQEHLFGKKSEAANRLAKQSTTDGLPLVDSPSAKTTLVASHQRKIPPRGKRQLNTQAPTYTVIHDLTDTEKNCACCATSM